MGRKARRQSQCPQHNPGDRRALCTLPGRVDEDKTFAAMMPLAAYLQRGGFLGTFRFSPDAEALFRKQPARQAWRTQSETRQGPMSFLQLSRARPLCVQPTRSGAS